MSRINEQNEPLKKDYERVILPTYAPADFVIKKAQGSQVWDQNDKNYIDLGGGIAVNCLGHSNPDLLSVLHSQGKRIWHTSNFFISEPAIKLANNLTDLTFANKVFFSNSGSEANEAAIKIARRFFYNNNINKTEILSFSNSFHGRSLLNIALGGSDTFKEGFGPLPELILQANFNDLKSVKKVISNKTAAIIVEPIQGESGIHPASKSFLQGLREICNKKEVILIFDEVQSGVGRTGNLYAYMKYGIKPDILTSAKGLAGGLPIGATLVSNKFSGVLEPGNHGSTFGGNPLVCAVANKVIEIVKDPKLLREVIKKEKKLVNGLKKISLKYGSFKEIRSSGLWIGCDLRKAEEVKTLIELCYEEGLITVSAGNSTLRMAPALNITDEEIKEALKRLEKALGKFKD